MRKVNILKAFVLLLLMVCSTAFDAMEVKAAGQFKVGAAVRDITPSPDMFPLTRKVNVTMTGVLDSISVRVIAMRDADNTALFICSETGRSLGPQIAEVISKHTGISLDNIVMTSTHSHATPEVTEKYDFDFKNGDKKVPGQRRWAKYAMNQAIAAVDEALASLRPASVGIGYSECYINVNRNSEYNKVNADGTVEKIHELGWNPKGISDRTVATVEFKGNDGRPIAFIVNYSVHGTVMHGNTCMPDGTTGISSDIPGFVSDYMERKYKGAVAMWLSGAAGDQNPIIQNDLYARNVDTGEPEEVFNNDYQILPFLSKIHFADVVKAVESIDTFDSDVKLQCGYSETGIPTKDGGDWNVGMQVVRLGNIGFACFSGELFTSTGTYLKQNALLKNTIVVNHCWGRYSQGNNYHADDCTIIHGGFGQMQAKYKPGYLNGALLVMMNDLYAKTGLMTGK